MLTAKYFYVLRRCDCRHRFYDAWSVRMIHDIAQNFMSLFVEFTRCYYFPYRYYSTPSRK